MKLHGPDAAAVMRQELQYSGPIIGRCSQLLHTHIYTHCNSVHVMLCTGRSDGQCFAGGHRSLRGAEVVVKPLTKSKLLDAVAR